MRIILLSILVFFTTLYGDILNQNDSNISTTPLQKALYLSYEDAPKRVIKGEMFSITIKTLSVVKNFRDIEYVFSNYHGLKLLDDFPDRIIDDRYFYDTFYFLVTDKTKKLPDIQASLIADIEYKSTTLIGKKLDLVTLNPKKDFSNIIADSFELNQYKTTNFDTKHNIIIFVATANRCNIGDIHFNNVYKQGIESSNQSYHESKVTYFLIVDKKLENFSFSYFNLKTNSYQSINIPILVDDDSVVAQSDLKPKDQSREKLKMNIAAGAAVAGILFILWRRKYIYLIFILIPLGYIAYVATPSKEICIKKGSQIYLLPVNNGTIFETTTSRYRLQKEGSVKEFIKVKLKNNKIGWVKNENLCSH